MKLIRTSLFVAAAAVLGACANVETASRNAPYQAQPAVNATQPARQATPMRVTSFSVNVPETLTVSEANRYYPGGDIVWRGDPMGNRHQQVAAIFENSLSRTAAATNEGIPVELNVEVVRFHALTEKARYTTGGVHAITFKMQIRDAKTKQLIGEPRIVEADLEAYGGDEAIEAEARGETQKVRISAHLVNVLRQEMSGVRRYTNRRLGILQAVNKL